MSYYKHIFNFHSYNTGESVRYLHSKLKKIAAAIETSWYIVFQAISKSAYDIHNFSFY